MSTERTVEANGIRICYETFGDPTAPALLLVMGFGVQLISWEPEFCTAFADAGFHVIRYDNRDTGRSTRFDGVDAHLDAVRAGDLGAAPYRLEDMAADGIGLLTALGIPAAHVVGTSMGGMLAQVMAIRWPQRVRSLCTIMSTTGAPGVGGATPTARAALTRQLPRDAARADVVRDALDRGRVFAGNGHPFDEAMIRARAEAAFDRAHYPEGKLRQMAAILGTPDRTTALRGLTMPTLVVHGDADPVVDVSGGRAIADAVPGAQLLVLPGMGHEIPVAVRARIVEAVAANAARADARV